MAVKMTNHEIPLSIIFAALILVLGAAILGNNIWNALAAVGTFLVVIVAVGLPFFLEKLNRPNLVVDFFEPAHPHLRNLSDVQQYSLSIKLTNKGRGLAKNAQPHITAMAFKKDGVWEKHPTWIPVPVLWALDEFVVKATGRPTDEKNLIPERPYVFNFLIFEIDRPKYFSLQVQLMPGGQNIENEEGEYNFEVTIFAEKTKRIKYFYINWSSDLIGDFEKFKKAIEIKLENKPRW